MASVVCQVCGAKTKASRLRCPRCGEVLAAAPAAAEKATTLPAVYQQYRGPLVLAGSVLSVIVLVAVIADRRAPVAKPPDSRPAPAPVSTPAPTEAAARPSSGFLDPKTGGKVAYASGDYKSALEHYTDAVAANPNDGDSLNNLGQVLSRNGDAAAAIPHLEKAVQLYPRVWAYRFNLAHAHGQVGNWPQAVDDYRQARNLFPDDYVTQFNLGMALHKMGDEEAAVSEFRKGAELAPSEPSFHHALGISYEQLNRTEDAVKSYEQYLVLAPSAPDTDKVKARIESLRKPA